MHQAQHACSAPSQLTGGNSKTAASDNGKRMRHHLEQAALYAGESSHGFRRGMPCADIGKKVQINTAATVEN